MARPNMRGARPDYTSISDVDWAKAAAFIDGEGCILIDQQKDKRGYERLYLRVFVTNTDPRLIRWFLERFGGTVMNYAHDNPNHRHTMKWATSCRQAADVLKGCLSHFVLKREQADIALAFQETMGFHRHKPLPEGIVEHREALKRQLHEVRWAVQSHSDLQQKKAVSSS